ncbi:MAG: hypothetical protein Q9209_005372 [Squamulea sp. 1 TL-2023]
MSKPASVFAGGWTPAKAQILNNTKLPQKTRCQNCSKLKDISHFSKKQQLDLKQRLAHSEKAKSPTAKIITCRACSEKAIFELTCCICDEPKSLDGFSKQQRKDPDNAVGRLSAISVQTGWAHVDEGLEEQSSDEDLYSDTVSNQFSSASFRFGSEDIDTTTSALKAASLSEHDKYYSNLDDKQEGSAAVATSNLSGSYGGNGKGKRKEKENQKGGFANPPRGLPQYRPDDIIDQLKKGGEGRVVNYSDDDTDSDGSFGML